MKKKYAFHPSDYAIGETEKFYSDMAAKGWELEKRGVMLSKFKKTEQKRTRYRVELIPRSIFGKDDEFIPDEEQLSIFKDCGWTYVTGANSVHIFSAPQGTDAPEFYLEPEHQAPIIKKIRNFNIFYLLLYFFIFFTRPIVALFFGDSLAEIFAEYNYMLIRSSTFELISMIFIAIMVVLFLAHYLIITIKLHRLYKKLKNGIPIDHSPVKKSHIFPYLLLSIISILIALIFLALSAIFPNETHVISNAFENPSILLSDANIEIPEVTRSHEHEIEYSKAALSEHWYTSESIYGLDYEDIWINQDIYHIKYDFMCESFAKSLMIARTYTVDYEDFVEVKIQGLDKAWWCENTSIAIKDNYVYLIRYHNDSDSDMIPILQAIAETDYNGMR